MDIMLKKHKESLVRQMEVQYYPSYPIFLGRNQYMLTQYKQNWISCSTIQDNYLINNSFQNNVSHKFLKLKSTEQMFQIIPENLIQNVLLKSAQAIEIYQALRKTFLNTLAIQISVSYIMGNIPQPKQLMIDTSNAKIFNSYQVFEQSTPNPLSIRFTRSFDRISGDIGVNGYLIPGFASFGLAMSQIKLNFQTYLKLFVFQFTNEKNDQLQRKINLMVFDEDCNTIQQFTSLPIQNKLELLLEISKQIYKTSNINHLKPWI